ncbi:hypothetical protein D3C78_1580820 [compost metagenome]
MENGSTAVQEAGTISAFAGDVAVVDERQLRPSGEVTSYQRRGRRRVTSDYPVVDEDVVRRRGGITKARMHVHVVTVAGVGIDDDLRPHLLPPSGVFVQHAFQRPPVIGSQLIERLSNA